MNKPTHILNCRRNSFSWHSFSGVCVCICFTSIQYLRTRIKDSYLHNRQLIFPELNSFFFFFPFWVMKWMQIEKWVLQEIMCTASFPLWYCGEFPKLSVWDPSMSHQNCKSLIVSCNHVSLISDEGKPLVDIEWTILIVSTSSYIILRQIFIGQKVKLPSTNWVCNSKRKS